MTALIQPSKILFKHADLTVLQTFACDQRSAVDINQPQKNSFGSFNLGLHVNDDPNTVLLNRCKLLAMLNDTVDMAGLNDGFAVKQIHWLTQVHGNDVVTINNQTSLSLTPIVADAMITAQSAVALAIMTADCVPIMLYQKTTGTVAAIHAGWKGLANGIIAKTVAKFADKGGIMAWIGACISVKNYEVSQDVLHKLATQSMQQFDLNLTYEQLLTTISKPHQNKHKAWLDIQSLARLQLQSLQCVIDNQRIDCSYDEPNYFSYRKKTHLNQPNTGRMAMLIVKHER